ncbi:ABC transporter permease [Treponema sp. R6D11]
MTLSSIWELKKLALRNLARHKVKTVLTSLAIMVSVAVYIFLNSWLGGMTIESRRNIVNFEIGAAKLQTKLYFEKKDEMPSYENFYGWEIYRDALSSEGYVSAPRYTFSGTLSSTSGSAPIVFYGVEPDAEREVLRYTPYVDFGRFVQNGNFEIALGTVAAEKLKVGIPSRPYRKELEELISITAQNSQDADFISSLYELAPVSTNMFDPVDTKAIKGNERMMLKKNAPKQDLDRYWEMIAVTGRNNVRINAMIDIKASPEVTNDDKENAVNHVYQVFEVVVAGVINSPDPLPNGNTAYIPLDVLQDETGMMLQGAVTELVIRKSGVPDSQLPGKSESSAAITAALNRGLSNMGLSLPDDLAVRTWQEYMQDYLGYEKIQTGMPQVLAFLLFLLSFLGISNTILLAILERTKEIGMMRAMGMTDSQMILTYMLEAGFLGLIGSVLGIILGCIINYPMVKTGIDFSAMADTLSGGIGFRTTAIFRSMWNIPVIIGSGIVATLLSSLVAYFPTRRALKSPITESLRFE